VVNEAMVSVEVVAVEVMVQGLCRAQEENVAGQVKCAYCGRMSAEMNAYLCPEIGASSGSTWWKGQVPLEHGLGESCHMPAQQGSRMEEHCSCSAEVWHA
jgi:hypothetical protein